MIRSSLLALAGLLATASLAGAQGTPTPPPPGSVPTAPVQPTTPAPTTPAPGEPTPEWVPPAPAAPPSPTSQPPAPPAPAPAAGTDAPIEQSFEDQPVEPEPDAAPATPAIGQTPENIEEFADATMEARRLRFALNAFGDSSATARVPAHGDGLSAFSLGTFALLINGQLGGSLTGTAELAFDATRENVQATKLERLHIRWQTPTFFVVGGRTHTDLGYWNTAFHHGAWLHLPITRPRAVRGEGSGGILPIHWIGVEGGVTLPIDPGAITIAGGVGNGRGHDERDIRLNNDSNHWKALRAKIEVRGMGWPDLRVGIGALYDRIAPEDVELRPAFPGEHIDETIANAYTAFRGVRLTLIAEGYAIWHAAGDDTYTTTDAFVVGGYRFGIVTPYLQLERVDAAGGVNPFYSPVPDMATPSTPVDQTEAIAGVRIDTSVWSALKAEYGLQHIDGDDGSAHTVTVNWSFGI